MEKAMEYILMTAKLESFSKAAEQLFITQPALSAIVHKEEQRLGVELFNRHVKPLELTEAGKTYLEAAKKIQGIEVKLYECLGHRQKALDSNIKICSYAFLISSFLKEFTEDFKKQYTATKKIELMEKRTEEALPLLQKGKVDFVITTHARKVKECASTPLLKEKIIMAVPKSYEINAKLRSYGLSYREIAKGAALDTRYKCVDLAYFADYPFIVHNKTKEMYRRARKMFRNAGFNPKIVAHMDDFLLMYFVALAGQGIVFIREGMVKYLDPSDKLVYYKIDDSETVYNVMVYYRQDNIAGNREKFLKYCQSYWQENQPTK